MRQGAFQFSPHKEASHQPALSIQMYTIIGTYFRFRSSLYVMNNLEHLDLAILYDAQF